AQAQSGQKEGSDVQIAQLRSELQRARADLANAQRRMDELAARLDRLQNASSGNAGNSKFQSTAPATEYESPADVTPNSQQEEAIGNSSTGDLTEAEKLLAARIEEQHQTKVESGSKYRVKLSGLMLMNAFSTRGTVDVADLPNLALNGKYDNGNFGATLRQTIFGLQLFGPEIAGARSSANVAVDFFGGFPEQPFGAASGVVRLRTASARLDWKTTSFTFGQEAPFFSPLSPTSFATVAEPAFSWAGNLWVWTPQAALEHRFVASDNTYVSVTGGVLAPVVELRSEDLLESGQHSRRPAFASQVSLHSKLFGQDAIVGAGAYGSRLVYDFGRHTNSWAFTSFWQVPFSHRVELSGEAYRGKAVGGLGGGIAQSVVYNGDPATQFTQARFLNSLGGWTQLKFRVHPAWELNGAIGQDNVLARDLEWSPVVQSDYGVPISRNRAAFGNVIFRPRSNLLFSLEYRKLWTFQPHGVSNTADQVNVAAGVSF
ncbi:MAG TPA: hypothetical protein VFM10_09620, partial [Terriglobales bacterium]|nr:hypothetical protein [Terriglobales bacterium]